MHYDLIKPIINFWTTILKDKFDQNSTKFYHTQKNWEPDKWASLQ